jgi:hypothetical protein
MKRNPWRIKPERRRTVFPELHGTPRATNARQRAKQACTIVHGFPANPSGRQYQLERRIEVFEFNTSVRGRELPGGFGAPIVSGGGPS